MAIFYFDDSILSPLEAMVAWRFGNKGISTCV
jgi:hypothetical protein